MQEIVEGRGVRDPLEFIDDPYRRDIAQKFIKELSKESLIKGVKPIDFIREINLFDISVRNADVSFVLVFGTAPVEEIIEDYYEKVCPDLQSQRVLGTLSYSTNPTEEEKDRFIKTYSQNAMKTTITRIFHKDWNA